MQKKLFDDVVYSLLKTPFSIREKNEQIDVVYEGRPQPTICGKKRKADSDENSEYFKRTLYMRYNWVCGSTYFQNIHCWPCLLFAEESKRWVYDVCHDVSDVEMFNKHALEESHVVCVNKLVQFRKKKRKRRDRGVMKSALEVNPKEIPPSQEMATDNTVSLNRKCIQFALDAILLMLQRQLPLVQENESSPCSYADLFHLLLSQSPDKELKNHFREMEGSVNPILSKLMLQGVVESIWEYVCEQIQVAVQKADFFSLRIDDGLDESSESALFIRIVNPKCELKEFFIGYYSLGSDRTSLSLFRILDSLLGKYEYKSKLIGIGFDITCIKFNYLKDLHVGMKLIAQQSTNVNLFGHHLDYMVEKCLSRIPNCRRFFADLKAIFNVIKNLVKRNHCPSFGNWREVCKLKNSCCSKFKLLSVMLINWNGMTQFFKEIQQETSVLEDFPCLAFGIPEILKENEFVFLAVCTRHLFQMTNTLYQELIVQPFDPVFCDERVKHVCVTLYRERSDVSYEAIYKEAELIMGQFSGAENFLSSPGIDSRYKPLFYEMLDNIIMELHTRFENYDQRTYIEIGNLFHSSFLSDKVTVAMNYYPKLFNKSKELQRELCTLVTHRTQATTPLMNVIYRLRGTNQNTFTHAYRLLSLITLQTPSTQKFPCLHEFSSYLKDSDIILRPYLASILMNQDILKELSNRQSFKSNLIYKLSLKFDTINLSHIIKTSEKQNIEILLVGHEPRLVVKSETDLLTTTVTPSGTAIEKNPTTLISSTPGPSTRMEPGSSMMEQDVHLDMTCEVYPADEPRPDFPIKIKEEPRDIDLYKQDILSASDMRELAYFSKEPSSTNSQECSLFQPPVLIKEEPISFEEEL